MSWIKEKKNLLKEQNLVTDLLSLFLKKVDLRN